MSIDPLVIAAAFDLGGPVLDATPLGDGLINDTYCLRLANSEAVLQRINSRVFHEPEAIIANMRALTAHAAARSSTLQIPELFRARDGRFFKIDANGDYWRAMRFIPNAVSFRTLTNIGQAEETGRALGAFHALLDGIDITTMHTTLPGFHIAPDYLRHYDRVRAQPKHTPGDQNWEECRVAVEDGRDRCGLLENAKAAGDLPLRIIHGDPKLDNFLFDRDTRKILGLIDLDTLQPGLIHYDIGDCIRSCCNAQGENSPLGGELFRLDFCLAFLRGYWASAHTLLTAYDIQYLFDAIRLIPWELGLRFLTDHLSGDVYFKVSRRGQNLDRARVQFRLAREIEQQRSEISTAIRSITAN